VLKKHKIQINDPVAHVMAAAEGENEQLVTCSAVDGYEARGVTKAA
jgi:hypothetical protein